MPDIADHISQDQQDAETKALEADIFDGYDPQTGLPIMAKTLPGGGGAISSMDSVPQPGDTQIKRIYFGEDARQQPREHQSPTPDAVHNALMDLFRDQPDVQSKVKGVLKDVGQGIVETPAAAIGGAVKGINEAVDMLDSLGDAITQKVGGPAWTPEGGIQWVAPGQWDATQGTGAQADMIGGRRVINPTPEPDSATGKFVEGVSQFLTGMAVGGRALKGAKMAEVGGGAVQAAARGAISDFAFFDGKEADLSTLIQGTPLANPVSAMLAVDKDDPELVGRLKRAAEGVGLGALTDGLLTAVRAIRTAKKARPATQVAEDPEAAQAGVAREQYRGIAGDPEGDVYRTARPGADPRAKLSEAGAEMDAAGTGPKRLGEAPERVGLNMARVNTPDDIAEILTRTEDLNQDGLARAVGYRSWAEANAASGGIDGYKLLMQRQAGRAFTDSEALAARKTDLAAWGSVRDAARAYQEMPTPAAAAALRETWVKAYAIHKELLGARAEAARALAVWRMTIDQADAKAAFRQMDAMFNAGGKETAEEIAKRVMLLDAVADPEAAAKFLEKSWMARGRDALAEAYQGALLSSPKSQVVNFLGNSVNLLYAMMERAAAGRLSAMVHPDDAIQASEAAFMGLGAREGIRDALRYAAKVLVANARTGAASLVKDVDGLKRALADKEAARADLLAMTGRKDEVFEPRFTARNLGVEDVPVAAQAVDAVGGLLRSFGGAMAFQDDLFKLVNHRAELYALASRQVAGELREGAVTRDLAGQRIAELVTSPPEEMLDMARRAAEDRTFTAPPGKAASWLLSGRRLMNSGPLPVGTILMPFVNTPANLMGYAFRRTPLAPLFKRYRDAVAAGGAEAHLARTQMAMGTMVMLLLSDYAASGMVTGGAPADPAQRELWRRSGIQPYSIKIGDKWVAYNRLDPVGTVMSLGADMAQLFAETPLENDDQTVEDVFEAVAATGGAIGQTVLNKTTLTGVSSLIEYLDDPQRYGESWLGSLLSPLVPNAVRDLERIKDPYLREASNVVDRLLGRVPGASEKLPAKIDLWGDPIRQTSDLGGLYDAFVPVPVTSEHQAPIDKELLRLHADIGMPARQISVDGTSVSLRNRPDIYNDLVRTAAQEVRLPQYYDMTLKEYLNALVTDQIYDAELYHERLDSRGSTRRDDGEKVDMIRSVVRKYREAAGDEIRERYARDLAEMSDRKRRALAGTGGAP